MHAAYLLRALQLLVQLIKQGLNSGPVVDVHLILQQKTQLRSSGKNIMKYGHPLEPRLKAKGKARPV